MVHRAPRVPPPRAARVAPPALLTERPR